MATETNNQTLNLTIDPEFEQVCPPLTEEEFQQLRKSILEDREIYMIGKARLLVRLDGWCRYV